MSSTTNKIEGRIRESADGLRGRTSELDKARLREAQQEVAEEAAAHRERRKVEEQRGTDNS